MIKVFFGAVLLLAGLAVSGTPSLAADSMQTTLQRAYDAQCAALVAHDYTAATNVFTLQFVATDVDNRAITRDEVIGRLNALSSQYRLQSCATRIVSVKESSGNYTVSAEQTVGGETAGFPPQSVQVVLLQDDAWQQVGSDWKIASSAIAERSLLVNGRVVAHDVRAHGP